MSPPAVPELPRRVAYLGTPEVAVPPLRALVDAGIEVPLVVSRADRRRGRRGAPTPSPVKAAALELGLEVSDDPDDLLALARDGAVELGVVVAYGRIIGTHLLDVLPMINLHFSLLPRWRGAAPVERALLAGDEVTGVCVMAVDPTLDTGDVYRWAEVRIGPRETADELRERLCHMGTGLVVETLLDGLGDAEAQRGEATYAEKITPDDLAIDWGTGAVEIDRVVRVGGAWTTFRGKRLKVWRAQPVDHPGQAPPGSLADGALVACGSGWLRLEEVQPEGKARMAAQQWRNGARPGPDERLGT